MFNDFQVKEELRSALLAIANKSKLQVVLESNKDGYRLYGLRYNLSDLKKLRKEMKYHIRNIFRTDKHLLLKYKELTDKEKYFYYTFIKRFNYIEDILS